MSVRRPSALLLAVCCLLLGPGLVAAAAPNQLRSGGVTPGTGTPQTSFTFSVVYSSERDFAATSVVALVAGRSVRLSLVSGSATAGTYRGSASLPAGRWPVSFEAQATQGPNATLAGPTVAVSAPAATPKPVPVTPAPTPKPVIATPVPTPRPPAAATAEPSGASTPTPIPAASTEDPSGSATPSAEEPASSSRRSDPRPGAGTASPSPFESSAPPAAVPGSLSPRPAAGEPDGMPPWLAIIGSAAAGAVLFVVWRRRARNAEEATGVAQPAADAKPISLVVRARQRQAAAGGHTEDPILAAMGVGMTPKRPPHLDAPLSRRVNSGPGERPEPAKSRRRAG